MATQKNRSISNIYNDMRLLEKMNVFLGIFVFLFTGLFVSPDLGISTFYNTTPVLYGSFLWLHISLGFLSLYICLKCLRYRKWSSNIDLLDTSLCFGFGLMFQIICQYVGVYQDIHWCIR